MSSNDTKSILDYVKKQSQIVAEIHDLLHIGTFPGNASQKLAMGQAYMKGLYGEMNKEVRRIEEKLAEEMSPTFTEALKEEIRGEADKV